MAETINSAALAAKVTAAFKADKRKTAILGVLGCVALLLAMRLLLGRNMPRRAVAVPQQDSAAVGTSAAAEGSARAGAGSPLLSENLDQIDKRITRDLFKVNTEAYPLRTAATAAHGSTLVDESLRREEVASKASRLQLQSTVMGSRPTAIINDLVVTVGDAVKERVGERLQDTGFVVKAIEEKACIVTADGVAVRLEMKNH